MAHTRRLALVTALLLSTLPITSACARDGATATAEERSAPAESAAVEPAPDPQDLQRHTLSTMRNVGTALMAWLTDEVGAAAAGRSVVVSEWPATSFEELEAVLVPAYLSSLPRNDAWGHPFEYRVELDDPMADRVFLIRSAGSDGQFDGEEYEAGPFEPDQVQNDLVWVDGAFMRWPEKTGPDR